MRRRDTKHSLDENLGGPTEKLLDHGYRQIDAEARQIISRELGHEQPEISKVYVGR